MVCLLWRSCSKRFCRQTVELYGRQQGRPIQLFIAVDLRVGRKTLRDRPGGCRMERKTATEESAVVTPLADKRRSRQSPACGPRMSYRLPTNRQMPACFAGIALRQGSHAGV